jgi:carboxypeptidase family protein
MSSNGLCTNARTMGGRTHARRNAFATLAFAAMFALVVATSASAADIVGRVANDAGEPQAEVKVSALNSSGAAAGSATSDAEGAYQIRDLKPGTYTLVLKGESVMSYLPKQGLTVNWGLSRSGPPLAVGKVGASPSTANVSATNGQSKGR